MVSRLLREGVRLSEERGTVDDGERSLRAGTGMGLDRAVRTASPDFTRMPAQLSASFLSPASEAFFRARAGLVFQSQEEPTERRCGKDGRERSSLRLP